MEVEESLLTFGETSDIYQSLDFNTHTLEGRFMRNGRDDQGAVIFEPYESSIEKVIDRQRQ